MIESVDCPCCKRSIEFTDRCFEFTYEAQCLVCGITVGFNPPRHRSASTLRELELQWAYLSTQWRLIKQWDNYRCAC